MSDWAKISYREYWDVPRIFFVEDGDHLYLFDCQFDEAAEDYPDAYQVFRMPPLCEADFAGSWAPLWERALERLGTVPVAEVVFDPTRRQAIDAAIFDRFQPSEPASRKQLVGAA